LCDLAASAKKIRQICLSFQHVKGKITPIPRNNCVSTQDPDILALQALRPNLLQLSYRKSLSAGQRKEFSDLNKQRLPNIEVQSRVRGVDQKFHA
jgi:hypothetical protein